MFRFIFNFIIPLFRATRQVKSQVREFQDRMNTEGQFRSAATQSSAPGQRPDGSKAKGDYIDFEEVRK
ncbi:MAG: hypothetical protein ABI687_02800 [Flavitalea sp.]